MLKNQYIATIWQLKFSKSSNLAENTMVMSIKNKIRQKAGLRKQNNVLDLIILFKAIKEDRNDVFENKVWKIQQLLLYKSNNFRSTYIIIQIMSTKQFQNRNCFLTFFAVLMVVSLPTTHCQNFLSGELSQDDIFALLNGGSNAPANCLIYSGIVCTQCENGYILKDSFCVPSPQNSIPSSLPTSSHSGGEKPQTTSTFNNPQIYPQVQGPTGPPHVVYPFDPKPQTVDQTKKSGSSEHSASYLDGAPTSLPTNKNLPCAPKPFCGNIQNFKSESDAQKWWVQQQIQFSPDIQIVQLRSTRQNLNNVNLSPPPVCTACVSPSQPSNNQGEQYSTTNTIEENVDEADILKTDGNYIYTISKGYFSITIAAPLTQSRVIYAQNFSHMRAKSMYIHSDYLVILGHRFRSSKIPEHTLIAIFDIKNRFNIRKIKEISFEGRLHDSRLDINGFLYLISKMDPVHRPKISPMFKRDQNLDWENMDSKSVYFFEGQYQKPKMVNIFCLSLNQPLNPYYMNMASLIIENSHQIYMANEALYITINRNHPVTYVDSTFIQKVYLFNEFIVPFAQAEVPGTINNQFSLDEDSTNITFRIITTTLKPAPGQRGVIITTFDQNLTQIAQLNTKLSDRVTSSRFTDTRLYFSAGSFSNRFYLVDFIYNQPYLRSYYTSGKNITYIHPYNENYVIGLGKLQGNRGLVVSLIDVSNAANVFEASEASFPVEHINSIAEFEHKAFFVSSYYEVMAIPVRSDTLGVNAAFIYKIKNDQIGFSGIINHVLSPFDVFNDRQVERTFFIGNRLYTKSPCLIRINDIRTFFGIKDINIPCNLASLNEFLRNPTTF